MNRKRATLAEVAKQADVSNALASYALNGSGRVSAKTAQHIKDIAAQLGYRVNPHALALRTGRETGYGFVIRNLKNPFFLDVLDSIAPYFNRPDRVLTIMDSRYSLSQQEKLLDTLNLSGTAAALVAAVGGEDNLIQWREETSSPIRLVTLNVSGLDGDAQALLPGVNLDHRSAVEQAVGCFASHGHRDVTMVCAPDGQESDALRRSTFLRACKDSGIRPHILRTPLDYNAVFGECVRLMRHSTQQCALLFNSDYLANAAYDAARHCGRVIGRDVSIIGHDDLATSRLLTPAMTTISFSRRALGEAITRCMGGDGLERITVSVSLIERASVATVQR